MSLATQKHQALVVDDDPVARTMIAIALAQESFECDMAENGQEALSKLNAGRSYDLLVTDLRMPRCHGCQLLDEVLTRPARPAVMVHTSVTDPVLTQELLRRGVEDVSYKPANYSLLALRARTLVQQHRARTTADSSGTAAASVGRSWLDARYVYQLCTLPMEVEDRTYQTQAETWGIRAVGEAEVRRRLQQFSRMLPVSQASLDVVRLIQEGESHVSRVAAAAAREPTLAVEILRLANSAYYNPRGESVADLDRAVMRIGLRRVHQLALATAALSGLTTQVLPWFDTSLLWRRCLATAMACDLIVAQRSNESGYDLFLPALLHGLGRVALGTVFPREYEQMVSVCRREKCPLQELERKVFPLTSTEVFTELLQSWQLPTESLESLRDMDTSFQELHCLPADRRDRTGILKSAMLVGYLAVGKWEPWDMIDLPPASWSPTKSPLPWSEVVCATHEGMQRLVTFRRHHIASRPFSGEKKVKLAYQGGAGGNHMDVLALLLKSLGYDVQLGAEASCERLPLVKNRIGTSTSILDEQQGNKNVTVLVVTDKENVDSFGGHTLGLPCSVAALQESLAATVHVPLAEATRRP